MSKPLPSSNRPQVPPVNNSGSTNSTERVKKRDIVRNFFGVTRIKNNALQQSLDVQPSVPSRPPAAALQVSDATSDGHQPILSNVRTLEDKPLPSPPTESLLIADIFPENLVKPFMKTELPPLLGRIETTDQLVYCNSLLLQDSLPQPVTTSGEHANGDDAQQSPRPTLDNSELDWLGEIKKDPIAQDRLRWLATRMVKEFIAGTDRDATQIAEIVALGPVLQKEPYRGLLSSIIKEFDESRILNVALLHGLVELIETASSGYLEDDDLVRALGVLRRHIKSTHKVPSEHLYQMVVAIARLLDVMVNGMVKDVNRTEDHQPLVAVLQELKDTSDTTLQFQVSYALQASQYIPDDESTLQAVLRFAGGVSMAALGVASICKLDPSNLFNSLDTLRQAAGQSYEVTKAILEGLEASQRGRFGAMQSLLKGVRLGTKYEWYLALLAAKSFVRDGRLADFKRTVCEAPCRDERMFQLGVCQQLGEIAIDPVWDILTRQQAVDFLAALHKKNTVWKPHSEVKQWIITILTQVPQCPEDAVKNHARIVLRKLHRAGIKVGSTATTCSLVSRLPSPGLSSLLSRARKNSCLEFTLHALKFHRLKEGYQPVYVPPMAKANLQASDHTHFPLMEKVQEFFESERELMLILGDSGAGKSTFNRHLEHRLWTNYNINDPIPLFINLPAIRDPEEDMVTKQLQAHNFNTDEIQELKQHHHFILICDGYDESQQVANLHKTNRLNKQGQWQAKMIISCRSQFLGPVYINRFAPQPLDHYKASRLDLFQEAVIAPFSKEQIEDYVEQYVPLEPRPWVTEDYMRMLNTIPNLMDLVKNPFLLTLTLEALPGVTKGQTNLSKVKVTRVQLYDHFVDQWFEVNLRRLQNSTLSPSDHDILDQLVGAGYVSKGVDYSTRLAAAIFDKQDGNPVVRYADLDDSTTWRGAFFGPEPMMRMLRESSPLTRTGNLHRFLHRSMLEYFFSRVIFDPSHHDDNANVDQSSGHNSTTTQLLDSSGPFFKRNLLTEPSVIQFLCERVQQQPYFETQLLNVIEQSKADTNVATAATNAITILVRAGVPFNGADLRGIRIPGADLSNGQLDSAQLQGADLTGVNFARSWLRQVNFGNAQMEGIRFEELPYQNVVHEVISCQYSPDGRMLAVGTLGRGLYIYETVAWKILHRYKHSRAIASLAFSSDSRAIASLAFSSDSQRLVLGSWDNMVTMWEIRYEKTLFVFKGHTGAVYSVALSPCGKRIASASYDKTVRLWNAETGEVLFVLEGHIEGVARVKYSADGQRLFSVCLKGEIRVWDPETGNPIADQMTSRSYSYDSPLAFSADGEWCAFALNNDKYGHEKVQLLNIITRETGLVLDETGQVYNITFSPDGQRIILSGDDNTIRLWDVSSGVLVSSYSGHISEVRACTFSPDGRQLASGDRRGIVRLWEVNLNQSIFDSQRLSTAVKTVAYSSDGQCILSGRDGFTIQQWNSLTGISEPIFAEMAQDVYSFAISPDGRWIATGDKYGGIRILRCKTYMVERTLLGHTMGVVALVFSPCGRWLVSCSWDRTARLWDLQDTNDQQNIIVVKLSRNLRAGLKCCAFLPTGHQFVIGTSKSFVGVFDVRTGGGPSGPFKERLNGYMHSLACSPDGRRVALVGDASSVYLCDLNSTKPRHELKGHTAHIHCVAYSPCGKWILSGGADRTIRLWHLRTGEVDDWSCVVVVGGSSDTVESLAWNPVVPMEFASGCRDGSVRVWRILSGGEGDGEGASVRMLWGHDVARLAASDSVIRDAVGLSPSNQKLLVQRGAINSVSSEEGGGSGDEEDCCEKWFDLIL